MDVSIIIVTWNSKEFLPKCLASLKKASRGARAEVIVVDNASADGSAELVRDQYPAVTLIRLSENLGFARACNLGIAAAHGRYCVFLNPDTEVLGQGIAHLVRFLDRHPSAAVAGGALLNTDHTLQASAHHFPTPGTALAVLFKLHRIPGLKNFLRGGFEMRQAPGETAAVDYVKGAFFIVRKAFLDEVGGFDERYFLWFEEVDLQRAAHERGWSVMYYPKARAIHWGGQSFGLVAGWKNQKQFLKSMGLYLQKWYGGLFAIPVLLAAPAVLIVYRLIKRTRSPKL